MDRRPIGVFDSGIGGLTVAHAITEMLPNEHIIYFGDTAHLPYGDKSASAICHYSEVITKKLLEFDCKIIVIACNSASSHAYEMLAERYQEEVIIVNVIDPVVETVTSIENISKVGVIGTKATIAAGVYERKLLEKRNDLTVVSLATPLLVPMIEEGYVGGNITKTIIDAYIGYPDFKFIDTLILACTHYPLIKTQILSSFENEFPVYDSAEPTARKVNEILLEKGLESDEKKEDHQFFVSDLTESFNLTARNFYGEDIKLQLLDIWD